MSTGAPTVTTLTQRKAAEAVRRRHAADAVVGELRSYAGRECGTFVVFGSYVAGRMGFDSDLDILIDFPPERSSAAWHFVEDVCAEHGISSDIHDSRTSRPAFSDRVRATGRTLP